MLNVRLRLGLGLLFVAATAASGAGLSVARAGASLIPLVAPTALIGSSTGSIFAVTNTSSGPGINSLSQTGVGVLGRTKSTSTAVPGSGLSGLDSGTLSTSANNGVLGTTTSGGFGVRGVSSTNAEGGVGGFATTGTGVFGASTTGTAVYGYSSYGSGAAFSSFLGTGATMSSYGQTGSAVSSTLGTGASISSSSGTGASISSGSGTGASINSGSGTGLTINSNSGIGAVITTTLNGQGASYNPLSYFSNPAAVISTSEADPNGDTESLGVVAYNPYPGYNYLLQLIGLADIAGYSGYFSVDGAGDVTYSGSLRTIVEPNSRGRAETTAYSPKSTESTVEDTGTAALVSGSAVVRLDPAYAQSIDLQRAYRVFLTPDGDTRGLYVAQKSATAFIVRETQAGHSSLSFDYRIVADAAGHAADRMAILTPAMKAQMFRMSAHRSPQSHAIRPTTPPAAPNPAAILKPSDPYRSFVQRGKSAPGAASK